MAGGQVGSTGKAGSGVRHEVIAQSLLSLKDLQLIQGSPSICRQLKRGVQDLVVGADLKTGVKSCKVRVR